MTLQRASAHDIKPGQHWTVKDSAGETHDFEILEVQPLRILGYLDQDQAPTSIPTAVFRCSGARLMNLQTLQEIAEELRTLDKRKTKLLRQRDQAIRKEIRAGYQTKSEVAVLTGLSRQRIGQIAEEEK